MAVMSLLSLQPLVLLFLAVFSVLQQVTKAYSGSEYALDTEYSGENFFDGWDFFTGQDPTGGFVTYYSRSSSQLAGLVNSSDTAPAYIGVDYMNQLPITSAGQADGAGRPSVRISSQRSWTHGLFIGDFDHAPNNICGTWPAFWTLGPNWPYTGEIDIMEGVNKATTNAVSLHTNETCIINSNSSTQLGLLSNTNCAYYPDYNVGCGVVDSRPASYGDFNSVGGGVYAMQWTSEYVRVWFFPRNRVPQDIISKKPNPSSWGLPAANLMGNCTFDQHFQQHKIIFDNTFCGEYAGNQYVWNSTVNSCAVDTGYATCDAYVAQHPEAFRDAYWSINYVRVYQLVDPASPPNGPEYVASLQPPNPANQVPSSVTPAPSPTASLCPSYNFTTIQNSGLTYEIECSFDPPGPDLPPPYPNYKVRSFEDCVAGCTYWNTVNGTNLCGGVSYDASIPFCYYKKYIDQQPKYRPGFAGARLIYYGYPQITDDPRSQTASSTSSFVEIIPTSQFYRPLITTSASSNNVTSFSTTSVSLPTVVLPPLGTATNETVRPTLNPGTPTVSFSGTESVPVTNRTSVAQTEIDTSLWVQSTFTEETSDLTSAGMSTTTIVFSSMISATTTTGSTSDLTATPSISQSTIIATSSSAATDPATSDPGFTETPTTRSSPITSTNTEGLPGPTVVANFKYAGCNGNLPSRDVLLPTEISSNMTIDRCVASCSKSYFAGVYGFECFCVNMPLTNTELVRYPDAACNIPCPGNRDQNCGGTVSINTTSTIRKRQTTDASTLILLTLYANTALLATVTVSSTYTNTSTITVVPVTTLQSSESALNTGSISYDIIATNTQTVTAIVTTWCDFCATCPNYLTTLATTITIPCPIVEPGLGSSNSDLTVKVPMMTTTRQCMCGIGGVASSIVATVPCETAIAALMNGATLVSAAADSTQGFFVPEDKQDTQLSAVTTVTDLAAVGSALGRPSIYTPEPHQQSRDLEGDSVATVSALPVSLALNGTNITLPGLQPVVSTPTRSEGLLPTVFTGGVGGGGDDSAGRGLIGFMVLVMTLATVALF